MNSRLFAHLVYASTALILLAATALAQVPPPPPPPNSAAPAASEAKATAGKTGSITGRVLGEDGQPLAGVSVSVARMSSDRTTNRTVSTDDEGNFRANNLAAGAYYVVATIPGFVGAPSNMMEGVMTGAARRYRLGESVTITMVKGGAITGKALDAAGQPLVGAPVWAIRVRDSEGRPVRETEAIGRPAMSDDRGVYRLYGLLAGSYLVYTSGVGEMFSIITGSREVSTYHPNATRDTAQEVPVAAGAEVQGIDIQHRGELGHAVSGTIVGASDSGSIVDQIIVELLQAGTGTRISATNLSTRSGNGFGIYGVPDGEYELLAQQRSFSNFGLSGTSAGSASAPRRVTVRGGDVTGIELKLLPLSSIAGRVVLEKLNKTDCQITRRGELEELLLVPRREDREARRGAFAYFAQDATPDNKGEFFVRDLEAGRYRLNVQLPSDHWYVKAMNFATPTAARPAPNRAAAARTTAPSLAASGIMLKGGEKLSGLTVTIAEGAAELRGRVDGKNLPSRLRVHLVPAEAEAASEALRYHEVVTREGGFVLPHLAPGKYWLHARVVPDDESEEKPAKPAAWDANERAKLRREAEAANNAVELKSCQRVNDAALRLGK
jgi:hypothetical protein